MARLMLLLELRARLRRRVMRVFKTEPKLFACMLAAHVGALSATEFVTNGLTLGWKLLTA
jgi:hypothetical protein